MMTPEEINGAIAEYRGIKPCPIHANRHHTSPLECVEDACWDHLIPNYCEDLNAMHEAERVLFESMPGYHERYWVSCMQQVLDYDCDSMPCDKREVAAIATATASQRAEAFLRTKGLWKA